ncbi:MAG TPA: protein kinase [Drouetiella sp.]|jgi:serine/threonine protein kinase/DNA-binding response OmpR family regulator
MPNILIVEDNVDLANVIRSLLELESHIVEVVHNGDEGLTHALSRPYDLIILDWDLPAVSGLEILSKFRALSASTPVIMLTGKDGIDDKEKGLDKGADDYITKPFNLKELGARVRAHLRRAHNSPGAGAIGTQFYLRDICIDPVNKRAARGARTYSLSENEFEVLAFAARYPHISPSSKNLLNEIWKNDVEKTEQKLRMIVRRLRKKFDPAGSIIFPHLYHGIDKHSGENISDSDPLIGSIFNDKYELIEPIGDGGSGTVYIANHLALKTPVALKILQTHFTPQSDTARRFHREAQLLGSISHANIVAVKDFGVTEFGSPYLVMELLTGGTLCEILETCHHLPVDRCLQIFTQVAEALEFAHSKGLVHRDIKPSNLMLTKTDRDQVLLKVIDFGMARPVSLDGKYENITQTGEVLGSPPYMSPEQCRGEEVDARSDIYSFGCALFESISGRLPFSGENHVQIFVKHVTELAPDLTMPGSELTEHAQEAVKTVVRKCLEKDPEKRFASARQLKQALLQLSLTDEKLIENETPGKDRLHTAEDESKLPSVLSDENSAETIFSLSDWLNKKKILLDWLAARFQ